MLELISIVTRIYKDVAVLSRTTLLSKPPTFGLLGIEVSLEVLFLIIDDRVLLER